ncbi:MAG: YraN family protein [Pseudomonadota bacterium]
MSDGMRYQHGLAAEAAVLRLYQSKGADVLATRYRSGAGEIDLVLMLDGQILFVEVKARKSHSAAALSVSARQQARIVAAAELWLDQSEYSTLTPCRFDVATCDATGRIEVVENAFGA